MDLTLDATVRLVPSVRMRWDAARNAHVLLAPETVIMLNFSAAAILQLCDGTRTVRTVMETLKETHPNAPIERDTLELLTRLQSRGWLVIL